MKRTIQGLGWAGVGLLVLVVVRSGLHTDSSVESRVPRLMDRGEMNTRSERTCHVARLIASLSSGGLALGEAAKQFLGLYEDEPHLLCMLWQPYPDASPIEIVAHQLSETVLWEAGPTQRASVLDRLSTEYCRLFGRKPKLSKITDSILTCE